jgi:predicted metalloprotease
MRWTPGRRSENLEDRRAQTAGRRRIQFPVFGSGGGGGRMPRMGLGGLLLLLLLAYLMRGNLAQMGGDPGADVGAGYPGALETDPTPGLPSPPGATSSPAEERLVDFVSFVLDDVQDTWQRVLPEYRPARLVLFRDAVESGCGFAGTQTGPFYCPRDEKVYIDLAFYEDLQRRFGAPGDFAQAYVLAHEIGHHVQKLTGIEPKVRDAQRANPGAANELSVRLELQADCLAGVWGHSTAQRQLLEEGDVEEGLTAAAAVGDDHIQRKSTGRVQPEAFTHGSSRDRMAWFRRGLESGDPAACDTFR